MTLVRYTGPVAAWRGVIGERCDGGLVANGKRLGGDTAPCVYRLTVPLGDVTFCHWSDAATSLAYWLECDGAAESSPAFVLAAEETPAGIALAIDGREYRLTVI